MERIPKNGEFYRHFKDKLYQIITVAEHSEDGQKLVIYQALYGDFKTYARPLEMFMSEVDHEKYPDVKQKYRFERVEFARKMSEEVNITDESDEEKNAESGMDEGSKDAALNVNVKESLQIEMVTDGQADVHETEEDDIEETVEPGLIAFLDTDNWDEKYNILVSLQDKMTDKLIDHFAVIMDVVIPEGSIKDRYEQLKICVRTRQKFESQHLR